MATDIIKSEGVQRAGMNTWKAGPQGCVVLGWLGGLQVRQGVGSAGFREKLIKLPECFSLWQVMCSISPL